MAESVSDQNVEDMLSSVRRLVSSELPRNQRPDLKESASALVLTQAQRVEPKPPMQAAKGLTLEERIAELEAAVGGQSNEWEPDGSEDQDVHRPDRIVYRPSRPRDDPDSRRTLRLSEIAMIETGPANDDGDDVTADVNEAEAMSTEFQHSRTDHEEAEIPDISEPDPSPSIDESSEPTPPAELAGDPFADAVARDVAAVVAEMAENSLIVEKDFEAALAEAVRDPAETRGMLRQDEEIAAHEEDAGTSSPEATTQVSEAPVEISDADESAGLSEPDATPTDESALEQEEQNATPQVDTAGQEPSQSSKHPQGPSKDLSAQPTRDAGTFDMSSEELRAAISVMIREELQGELGERITRNVRKLVRQEVHRALSVRDLE